MKYELKSYKIEVDSKNTDLQLGKIDRYFYILVLLSTPWQITNNPALIFLEINFDEKKYIIILINFISVWIHVYL